MLAPDSGGSGSGAQAILQAGNPIGMWKGRRGPGGQAPRHVAVGRLPPSILVRQRKTGAWSRKSCWTLTPPLVGTQAKSRLPSGPGPSRAGKTSAPVLFFSVILATALSEVSVRQPSQPPPRHPSFVSGKIQGTLYRTCGQARPWAPASISKDLCGLSQGST